MNISRKGIALSARICLLTCLFFGKAFALAGLLSERSFYWIISIPLVFAGSFLLSLPVLGLLSLVLPRIRKENISSAQKMNRLFLITAVVSMVYGIPTGFLINFLGLKISHGENIAILIAVAMIVLYACALAAILLSVRKLSVYFSFPVKPVTPAQQQITPAPAFEPAAPGSFTPESSNKQPDMDTTSFPDSPWDIPRPNRSNKIFIKGIITGILILVMLIPTVFITDLVKERQSRQATVVREVSSRWAGAQTLSGPYIYLPYKVQHENGDKTVTEESRHLLLLPENLNVNGRIDHELRQRSIYKVLLYRASLSHEGDFQVRLPNNIQPTAVQWQDARICYGLTDLTGIEEKILVSFNGTDYELSPGLPATDIYDKGLSAPVALSAADLGKDYRFRMGLKIKGSEQLHFIPFAGNSRFALESGWGNPSFDGYNLPAERAVSDSGFSAKWSFNKISLPFGTLLQDAKIDQSTLAFGVTMVQPADGYAKASRCVKYAILFIGLTFALFFIVELMQSKPVHPVQYVLVGLALVIFYTLLLAISEFLPFDTSYGISSLAVILLISLYARGHFGSWRSAGLFGGVLTLLYGFIFVLIRLEDTALLIGSIGLFLILALAMYASRKINWYGTEPAA